MKKIYLLLVIALIMLAENAKAQEMDYVNLQFPQTASVTFGNSGTVYTQGYEMGVTEAVGPGVGVTAWIGLSTTNSNPNTWTTWMTTTYNFGVDPSNNDEFQTNIGANLAPGTYYYASRWQLNGGPFRYGGYPFNFWDGVTSTSGVLTVGTGAAPANNECVGAISLTSIPTAYTNAGATQSMAPEVCAGTSSVAQDVWYRFTTTANGSVTITVDNVTAGMDASILAYSGTCGALANIGCVNATGQNGNEVLILNGLLSGQTYYLRVYGNTLFQGSYNMNIAGGALPVSIQYFRGSKTGNGHLLDWKLSCYNSPTVTMVLERSNDARNFTPLYNITETAARCLQPFLFTDNAAKPGINYYRLKSIDVDAKTGYSTIVALINADKGFELVNLMPNPAKDNAMLSISSAVKSSVEIIITDRAGRQLSKQNVQLIAGNNQLPLKLTHLPAGSYQVTGTTAEGKRTTVSFVKE